MRSLVLTGSRCLYANTYKGRESAKCSRVSLSLILSSKSFMMKGAIVSRVPFVVDVSLVVVVVVVSESVGPMNFLRDLDSLSPITVALLFCFSLDFLLFPVVVVSIVCTPLTTPSEGGRRGEHETGRVE